MTGEHPKSGEAHPSKMEVSRELMHRIYNVLSSYANEATYEAPRIGGVAQGCPRGETPTPQRLVWSARWMLREIEHQVLKRDAWDWIGKYEPIGPHCDTCRCNGHETTSPQVWPPPPRKITLSPPDDWPGLEHPECYTALSIGGHEACILVVTKMEDGSPVPPYAQQTIDWMLGRRAVEPFPPQPGDQK